MTRRLPDVIVGPLDELQTELADVRGDQRDAGKHRRVRQRQVAPAFDIHLPGARVRLAHDEREPAAARAVEAIGRRERRGLRGQLEGSPEQVQANRRHQRSRRSSWRISLRAGARPRARRLGEGKRHGIREVAARAHLTGTVAGACQTAMLTLVVGPCPRPRLWARRSRSRRSRYPRRTRCRGRGSETGARAPPCRREARDRRGCNRAIDLQPRSRRIRSREAFPRSARSVTV